MFYDNIATETRLSARKKRAIYKRKKINHEGFPTVIQILLKFSPETAES